MSKPRKQYEKKYSGPRSNEFWDRVNAISHSENAEVYALGCALQDLETRTISALGRAEEKARRPR